MRHDAVSSISTPSSFSAFAYSLDVDNVRDDPYLLANIAESLVPPSVVLAIYWYIPLGVQVQPWILALAASMSIPLTFTVRVQRDLFHQRQEATSMGAVMSSSWRSHRH
jgi:hypothetical protein